jgi:hypothetical protein
LPRVFGLAENALMQTSAWEAALARLRRLGLSGYEAKAYLTAEDAVAQV